MLRIGIVTVLIFIRGSLLAQETTNVFHKVVNRLVEAYNAADHEGIQRDFAKVMLEALPLEKSKPFFTGLMSQFGKIQGLDAPRYAPPNQAIFPARFERGILDIKLVLDHEDKIIGLFFLPHTPSIPVPDKNETKLSLPFKGQWLVIWGGDTKDLNQHHDVPNQKFAFDFVGVNGKGETRTGDGKTNADYFAFGREVIAPADGLVTDVIDGVRDNLPGSMNPYSALGNAVMIQHGEHEVSVLAHLKFGSVRVRVGEKVRRAQVIGLCGNSGNSSEPHLHYHLQNTPIIQDGSSIKCYFGDVIVAKDGKEESKTTYSPTKGEIISTK